MYKRNRWSKKEDDFLRENAKDMTVVEMSAELNRSPRGVMARLGRIGISLWEEKGTGLGYWSKEEDDFLSNNYQTMTALEISKKINRSIGSIYDRVGLLGLEHKYDPIPSEGRVYKTSKGYKIRYFPNGKTAQEHRNIYEDYYNIKLEAHNIIHHIDGDGFNNNIDNLWYCKDVSTHKLCHIQLEEISYQMINEGFIKFSHENGLYYLNDNRYLESGENDE